ncbi:hypothetical protein SODALDRAFT_331977 [Sodiomyces alkalinus F11]|uniref:Uncharacterized protein n=1 Tax=Sodiomyces alkalinus (strain CBS 110278 / VKM F-3762 / F11) TaxID=1314773 RepID=A0A3N2PZI8_SODAK|nr:hypothetical protein SODALDRAFT_331977 [Sodiomyces alkalinus F11]ROT39848.1 hypothetical protein SODALDRAFT_331977 [Sodiomyces alkalinus F11]
MYLRYLTLFHRSETLIPNYPSSQASTSSLGGQACDFLHILAHLQPVSTPRKFLQRALAT